MSIQLRTETEIGATAERVWDILTDFAAYPAWNPFIPRLDGSVAVGARLDARLQPPGGRGMRFRPTVLAADPSRDLRWVGHLGVPGLFDGEHSFRIEAVGPDRVHFIQEEHFSGLLTPFILRFAEHGTRQGFEAMNRALKTRAERPTSTGQEARNSKRDFHA